MLQSVIAWNKKRGYAVNMTETMMYVALFLLGSGLVFFRPVARALKISHYWEIGIGNLLIIAFIFHLTSEFVVVPAMEQELAKQPCGPSSPQGRCYSLERSLCENAWQGAEIQCKAEMAEIFRSRPTALVGPLMNKCRAKKIDQVLKYNRANTDSQYCKAYFDVIEDK